jgi:hypothetical protein
VDHNALRALAVLLASHLRCVRCDFTRSGDAQSDQTRHRRFSQALNLSQPKE